MKVVHYILGFPPHRSGGMTKYAIDLMKAQVELQHEVIAIYPGNFSLFSRESELVKQGVQDGFKVWKLKNALPVPLLYGIKEPSLFCRERKILGFSKFLAEEKPDVFHIHTLMGIPKELIILFHNNGIKVIFTTHDYFGLCPRVNFIDSNGHICRKSNASDCMLCCKNAKGLWFLKLRNMECLAYFKKILK